MTAKVTLKDVAAHAGVSRTTASYVITGTGRVSESTKKRVHASMEALGYVYNQGAASLRRRSGTTVGVLVTNIDNPFFGELLVGLEAALTAAGYLPLVVTTADRPERQLDLLRVLREHQVAGLAIVPATGTDEGFLDAVEAWGVPHVLMTRYLRGRRSGYVGPDDVAGGRVAAEHLIEHGCRTFAFLGGPEPVVSRGDRAAGVRAALDMAGIGADRLLDLPSLTSGIGGFEVGKELVTTGGALPDGILCHSDTIAMGLYHALHRAGRADETRVIGYDDISAAALYQPTLTTVATHPAELGRRSAEQLLSAIGENGEVGWNVSTPALVIRRSCGCLGC